MLIDVVSGNHSIGFGIGLAFSLLGISILQSIVFHHHWAIMMRSGIEAGAGLSSMIYEHCMSLSNVDKGSVTTLMSVDASQIAEGVRWLNLFWSAPLQVILIVIGLVYLLGWSALSSVVIIILMLTFNGFMVRIFTKSFQKRMTHQDNRIRMLTEALNGILVLKLFCWESWALERIAKIRRLEVSQLRKVAYVLAIVMFFVGFTGTLIIVYVIFDGDMSPSIIFPALALFQKLVWPLLDFPYGMSQIGECYISMNRIKQLLEQRALEPISNVTNKDIAVNIEDNASFQWGKAVKIKHENDENDENDEKDSKASSSFASSSNTLSQVQIHHLNLSIKKGQFIAVIGSVGSGKTSLLSSIVGLLSLRSGNISVSGSKTFCGADAWLINDTLQRNITFGHHHEPIDKRRYRRAIESCALNADLEVFPGGDQVEIGSKGYTLSGGQKARVQLARAVYHDADVYLLDDPLSAVDAEVGAHLFDKCLRKTLSGKTRILVTHQVQYLENVDYIYVMSEGTISTHGTYQQLVDSGFEFHTLISAVEDGTTTEEDVGTPLRGSTDSAVPSTSLLTVPELKNSTGSLKNSTGSLKDSTGSLRGSTDSINNDKSRMIDEEEKSSGAVAWSVYREYLLACGSPKLITLIVGMMILAQAATEATNVWLASWSNHVEQNPEADTVNEAETFYLPVYGSLGLVAAIFALLGQVFWYHNSLKGAIRIHDRMLNRILHTPLAFFHRTPIGRIVNRFSEDTSAIDQELPEQFSDFTVLILSLFGVISVILIGSPWFALFVLPLGYIFIRLARVARPASRETKRLQSMQMSPVYSLFEEMVDGIPSIRAAQYESTMRSILYQRLDIAQNIRNVAFLVGRWFGFRVDMLGSVIIFSVAMLAVTMRDMSLSTGSAAYTGLSLSYSVSVCEALAMTVLFGTSLEATMNRMERVIEYSSVEQEPTPEQATITPPSNWPSEGKIEFKSVSFRYREDLPRVLNDISCIIPGGHSVGVVGRTGAGKSSLLSTLFRLIELDPGSQILIDSVDIGKISLERLRTAISIIPQDPFVFEDTVRANLCPWEEHSDAEIYQALEKVGLKDKVNSFENALDEQLGATGESLSLGEKQLLCLARALLEDCKVLVLDEATASVDNSTDNAIQRIIREEFVGKTILTIAHRLATVIDSDLIMVLDKGKLIELGPASSLLAKDIDDKHAIFKQLVEETGESASRYLHSMANKKEKLFDSTSSTSDSSSNLLI